MNLNVTTERSEITSARRSNTADEIAYCFHGVPESNNKNNNKTTETATSVFNEKLGLHFTSDDIDCTHCRGRATQPTSIVKLCSYETRQTIFTSKRKLMGTKLNITEYLTRRRYDLLNKSRALDKVKCTWTIDGWIVCLLADGRKITIPNNQDLHGHRGQ